MTNERLAAFIKVAVLRSGAEGVGDYGVGIRRDIGSCGSSSCILDVLEVGKQ